VRPEEYEIYNCPIELQKKKKWQIPFHKVVLRIKELIYVTHMPHVSERLKALYGWKLSIVTTCA
jgi:hypothetical protein